MEQSVSPTWAKEYSEGWDDIVNTLVKDLHEKSNGQMSIFQIKTKFGGLRAYIEYTGNNDEIREEFDALIKEAEVKASQTCEYCGEAGKLIGINSWYVTICEKDHQKILQQREEEKAEVLRIQAQERQERQKRKLSTVCDTCGKTGKYRKNIRKSITVLCDEHYEEWEAEIQKRKEEGLRRKAEREAENNGIKTGN